MIKAVKPLLFSLSALTLAVTSISAHAEEHFRQHGAHVHGSVELNIAQDGQDLLVEIRAPGADVIGFEHMPKTEEQHKIFDKAMAHLNSADSILQISDEAGCTLTTKEVTPALSEGDHDDHEGHDHEGHDHDGHDHDGHDHHAHEGHDHEGHDHDGHDHDGHDHDGHDHHAHEGHDHDGHHDGHGQFNIAYQYQCKDMSKLTQIDTNWFKLFSGTKVIHANLLTDSAQLATELTKGNSVIKL
ncbi:hypothetical protein VHA01S_003_01580 [Vibrio halioticoli NBRC 102217]|uniref:DUF2796 domain-containing protein n=1 Tax=Vibrio halioticoli NBRC 102217 TaxID=1219072 RepID=V5FG89_9VIBR|nr:DUF2796 domain-containing protein [Vibrio halioticoli]GAD88082.1 hypothetical protein VHA01S_003_01580 [Vibrio halioticoli NBRC 102217]